MRISDWSSDVCSSDLLRYRDEADVLQVCDSLFQATRRLLDLAVGHGIVVPREDLSAGHRTVLGIDEMHAYSVRNLADVRLVLDPLLRKIGRASCRERVCQYV